MDQLLLQGRSKRCGFLSTFIVRSNCLGFYRQLHRYVYVCSHSSLKVRLCSNKSGTSLASFGASIQKRLDPKGIVDMVAVYDHVHGKLRVGLT